jgi:nucleotide-binding universal stress UspA family protein
MRYAEHEHPYSAIIDAANKNGCDLIAMASHGRHGLAAVVLGSETIKVLTHSTVPVLVYR